MKTWMNLDVFVAVLFLVYADKIDGKEEDQDLKKQIKYFGRGPALEREQQQIEQVTSRRHRRASESDCGVESQNLKKEIEDLKRNLSNEIDEKRSCKETVTVLRENEPKRGSYVYLEREMEQLKRDLDKTLTIRDFFLYFLLPTVVVIMFFVLIGAMYDTNGKYVLK